MKSITAQNLNIFFLGIRFIYHVYNKKLYLRSLFFMTTANQKLSALFSIPTTSPTQTTRSVYASFIPTHLGDMLVIADDACVYMVEFFDNKTLNRKIARIKKHTQATIVIGRTPLMDLIEKQITSYFQGIPFSGTIPLCPIGSSFQKSVWKRLQEIPFGQTCSYAQIAQQLGNPKAFRAVANANGSNPFCIVIPCHRVINSSGSLGGYGGGIPRKKWLLDHENKSASLENL